MERLTVPAKKLEDGRTVMPIIDGRAVREHAMDLYWRLKEYEDLEEQGLLLKLPCKLGDTIYRIGVKCDFDDVPKDFNCDITDCDKCFYGNEYVIREIKANHFHIRQFMEGTAEYIFLTKAEAEAEKALKEMYGSYTTEGLIALFYRNLWAMAELYEKLKRYEELEEQGRLLEVPCKVGDEFFVIAYRDKKITHVRCTGYSITTDNRLIHGAESLTYQKMKTRCSLIWTEKE